MAKSKHVNHAAKPPAIRLVTDGSSDDSPRLKDVWSRSGSKYRVRAVVLFAVNVLLFAGVGSFAFWLRSGERFAPALDGYWDELAQTFRFGERSTVSLATFLIEPINVQDVPMQIPIIGLLMAALISIPILISILYRFWSSLPFIAVVGFLAVMPWLAITLLGSCILASVRPFRPRLRFMAALLALAPTVVYLILAWRGSGDVLAGRIDPIDTIKFIAPWVLAIVAAALAFAIVLTIARVVDYRPGAITPLLAIMFGLPIVLFEFHVGRDELYYRLLEKLNEAHFADIDASLGLEEAIEAKWVRLPMPRPRRSEVRQFEEQKWQFELAADLGPHQSELTRHQTELAHRCDWFKKHFPNSPYICNALYIKARAFDMRVDPAEFRATKWIRFYGDFPSPASRRTWRILAENRPDSILGGVALLRLAQLEARVGDIERAVDKLARVTSGVFRETADSQQRTAMGNPGLFGGVLERENPEVSLGIGVDRLLLEAHRLYALLTANRDPLYGYDPISGPRDPQSPVWFGLLDLDPRGEEYVDNLRRLLDAYPKCQIEDNIHLEISKASSELSHRIRGLEECLERYPAHDSTPEATFRLAVACKNHDRMDQANEAFAKLYAKYPDSIWTKQARRYVQWPMPTRVTKARQ
ncbi:MAG: tetratricopeptide repeat protein [Phycisphaerales bacterium]|nr:MAG: tetratricopeptide repeat protein [Phycisphaerales bacterium]